MTGSGAKRESTNITLCPETTVSRQPPANLREPDVGLFRHEFEKTIPAARLIRVNNVRVSPEGILIKGGKILPESFAFPFLRDEWKTRSVVKLLGRNYLFRKVSDLQEEAVWITDAWSTGYFHWLADVLSKLYLIRDLARERIVLLPQAYSLFDFVRPSLAAFEIQKVQFMNAGEVVRCQKLLLPTPVAPSGHFRNEVIQGVRRQLLAHFGAGEPNANRRIYISRARAPKRRISNEDEVLSVLQKLDFEIVYAEDLAFVEQVKLFSQARYLVSNHGAGLTNMLFLQDGGSVLELRHHTDRINHCYFTLASALNLNYFYQKCDPLAPDEDAHTADLTVDVEQLKQNLEQMTRDPR